MDEITQPADSSEAAFRVTQPLHGVLMWIKLVAWISIVTGVLQCLTIIGAVVGWIPIWIGTLVLRSAKGLEEGFANRSTAALRDRTEAMAKAIKLYGILMLIGLGLTVLYMLGLAVFFAIAAMNQ